MPLVLAQRGYLTLPRQRRRDASLSPGEVLASGRGRVLARPGRAGAMGKERVSTHLGPVGVIGRGASTGHRACPRARDGRVKMTPGAGG